ncbi:hypothetical protein Sjap_026075 [Stephania japonica]|uniref:UBC core domain-containing protein n=1 Tax=Stephania japonica TaxID=461633 RepID=A0AAP0HG62_9MAGN
MANSNLPRRIIKETQRLLSEPAPGISASPSEDNMRYFNVMILGPTQSPYEGGVFKLELFLPEEYPMAAPKVWNFNDLSKSFQDIVEKLNVHDLYNSFHTLEGKICMLDDFGHIRTSSVVDTDFFSESSMLPFPSDPKYLPSAISAIAHTLPLFSNWHIFFEERELISRFSVAIFCIQALLSAPNPDDPLSDNIAKHWKANEAEAVETAKEWTRLHASGA